MSASLLDSAQPIRSEESLNTAQLEAYFKKNIPYFDKITAIKQFTVGYSNLTYLIQTPDKEYVLRTPPKGAKIKSAHDMAREYKVLSLLKPIYKKIPEPILYCDDLAQIGVEFYVMERVTGIILRHSIPKGLNLTAQHFKKLSIQTLTNLVALHNLELEDSNLISLGKPQAYVERQVRGWIQRYFKAETDSIKGMNFAAEWLQDNKPQKSGVAFIHNDYKVDNLVLDAKTRNIKS